MNFERTDYLAFAIENYRHAKGLTGLEAIELLDRSKALKYIVFNFQYLHVRPEICVIESIDEFIREGGIEPPPTINDPRQIYLAAKPRT